MNYLINEADYSIRVCDGCIEDVVQKVMDILQYSIDYIVGEEETPSWMPIFIHISPVSEVRYGYSTPSQAVESLWLIDVAGCYAIKDSDDERAFVFSFMKSIHALFAAMIVGSKSLKLDLMDMLQKYMGDKE